MKLLTAAQILCFVAAGLFRPVASISCAEFGDGNHYSPYENMLLEDDANLLELEREFFPTNYRFSIVVDVKYHFIFGNTSASDRCVYKGLNLTCYHFRWVISPINLFIRPELLTSLSLYSYRYRPVSVDLYLNLPFDCWPEFLNQELSSSASSCDHPPAHLRQLNRLTANVSSV
jgi:hypothetical protein